MKYFLENLVFGVIIRDLFIDKGGGWIIFIRKGGGFEVYWEVRGYTDGGDKEVLGWLWRF